MNKYKRSLIERLVKSIDHAEKRLRYWKRISKNDESGAIGRYDILIRFNDKGE